jgi:hypothetical protein
VAITDYFKNYLFVNFAFEKKERTYLKNSSNNTNYTIQEWLQKGSTAEDSPLCRASNHFHDPLKPWLQSQMSDYLLINILCPFPRYSNVTWATSYSSPGTKVNVVSPLFKRISWDSARQ